VAGGGIVPPVQADRWGDSFLRGSDRHRPAGGRPARGETRLPGRVLSPSRRPGAPRSAGGHHLDLRTLWLARPEDRYQASPLAGPEGWITFVDLTGARVRVRAGRIQYRAHCYAENRAEERRFWRSHKAETKAERDWDED
jgi:hypothetical protein